MDYKKLTLSLSALAASGALVAVAAVATASTEATTSTEATVQAGDYGNGAIAKECLDAAEGVPSGVWRAAARIDISATEGLLAVRSDDAAAVCTIEDGHGGGVVGGDFGEGEYSALTAARPFDFFNAMNYETESVLFGVATDDVVAVSLVGPDGAVIPATLVDGTFIAVSPFGENSNEPTTNYVRATLNTGQVVEGPFRD